MKRAILKPRSWFLLFALLAIVAIIVVAVFSFSPVGKITILSELKRPGGTGRGNIVISPAIFRFQNRERRFFGLASTVLLWRFMVLTNDGKGRFVMAFDPEAASFSTSANNSYEFWVRDARLLDCEWKVQVVRKVRYEVPRIFSFLASTVPGPDDIWASEAIKPSLDKWKFEPTQQETGGTFRFPDHPTPTNSQPSFLTNSGSLFGERGLRYTR